MLAFPWIPILGQMKVFFWGWDLWISYMILTIGRGSTSQPLGNPGKLRMVSWKLNLKDPDMSSERDFPIFLL